MDIFTKEKRSELMKKVRNKNTNIELLLRKELSKKGYRFRLKNSIYGKPDIVFVSKKIAIFCDGDFWHGKNYSKEKSNYKNFWVEKIKTNIQRDRKVNKKLKIEGWTALRFWKTDILKNLQGCVDMVENILRLSRV